MKNDRKLNKRENAEDFYGSFFTEHPYWSTPYPNPDEAARLGKIMLFLSFISRSCSNSGRENRILDIGCGRGWLTKLASAYGVCHGIDPAHRSIEYARKSYPELDFYNCDLSGFLRNSHFKAYDIVIASEIIEHVVDKREFVRDLAKCLVPNGHAIITSPRGEIFKKWQRLGYENQPIEEWLTEKQLCLLFQCQHFQPILHDRVYINLSKMSFLNRLCASRRLLELLAPLRLMWFLKGLQYAAGFYQSWWFRLGIRIR